MNTPGTPGLSDNGAAGVTALTLKPGDKVDNYEIVQQVGAGGTGVVYAAFDAVLNRTVAIKQVIAPPGEEGNELRQRAAHEAKQHRNVAKSDRAMLVQFIDVVSDPRGIFLITEFVDGPTLEWILQSEPAPMEQRQALGIIAATAKGLSSIHATNTIHRDLKPSNVLMPRAGGLKIADFGLSAALSDQQSMDLGSVRYMAPELLQGERGTTASDIYSLGIIAYEMLAGREKFNEAFRTILRDQRNQSMRWVKWHTNARAKVAPLKTLIPDMPDSLSGLVERMMEKEPSRRIANTNELMEAIRLHFASGNDGAIPTPPPHQAMQPATAGDVSETAEVPKRSKVPMILVGMLVFWLVAIGGFFIYKGQQRSQQYEDRVAQLAGEVQDADKLHHDENAYEEARVAFMDLRATLKEEGAESPESFKDEFTDLYRLAEAGIARAEGMLSVAEADYDTAYTFFEAYQTEIGKIEGDPARLAQTTLSLEQANNLVDSHTKRRDFQQIAEEIDAYLDDGELEEAIVAIRTQEDIDDHAQADQERLVALSARYRQLRNAKKNDEITERVLAMIEDGDDDDAIEELEAAIGEDPDAADPVHRTMLSELTLKVRRQESDAAISRARRRNNTDDEIDALGDRIAWEPNPEPFRERYNLLINDRDVAIAGGLIDDGSLDEAVALLREVLIRDPQHQLARDHMASIDTMRAFHDARLAAEQAFGSRSYEQAITLARRAIDIAGDRDNRMNEIIDESTGQLALAAATTAMEDGDVEVANEQLATARIHLGNNQQIQTLQNQITALADYSEFVRQGDAAFARGEFGRAKRFYIDAREIFSNQQIDNLIRDCDFNSWLVTCDNFIQRQDWDQAAAALTQAEAIKTNAETRQRREILDERI